jgi:hypothetical protein
MSGLRGEVGGGGIAIDSSVGILSPPAPNLPPFGPPAKWDCWTQETKGKGGLRHIASFIIHSVVLCVGAAVALL